MTDKAAMRATMRHFRDQFVARVRPAMSARPGLLADMSAGKIVAAYLPMGSEADAMPLIDAAIGRGCAIALPHVTHRHAPMRLLAWAPGDPLEAGPFGLRQPRADAPEVAPDIILTPLMAFDSGLNRLGQGAGYYDRFFALQPTARRIGVAWSMQHVGQVPTDPWDVALHAVITEQDWIAAL